MSKTSALNRNLMKLPKGSIKRTDRQAIFYYLQENVATAAMVELATGISRNSICRYKKDLEEAGLLWEVARDYCKRTGCMAWYLTTNPHTAAKCETQLSTF